VAAWYGSNGQAENAVLLLHSVRATRREMVPRAQFLLAAGFAVLLIDMQAHGETPGARIGFGYEESRDVLDAVAFLRKRHGNIGIIGMSLGGAAAIFASGSLEVEAVIAEAVYSDLATAAENRLRIHLGPVGPPLAPLLLWQLGARLERPIEILSPAAAVADLKAPLLVIAGELDERTTLSDSMELYNNAREPKELWVVPGAKHQNYHEYARADYERLVLQFLRKHLRPPAGR
ncbi:MAG: alpha/beta fold hydrolase, partial [Gammaproteobacteria bacterium]|nr:alpha/beta fold hydrolase [Gammaproteobacteria bacterium]